MLGRTLTHYQILEKLGAGGMGEVYKARDTRLGRLVAVKVLPPDKVSDPERKRRFQQEARSASALNHPNIVTIHDMDEAEGHSFIVMEYVPGKTLDALIPNKGLRLNEALRLAVQVADALSRAHDAGITHRDIKPSNVIVDDRGAARVLDFGLAKLSEPGDAPAGELTRTIARVPTEEGVVLGTSGYMSPEQAEGKTADARSDIFSFGATLYEMICGERAFPHSIGAVVHKEPAPLPDTVPSEVKRVVTRCLRKDPERRFQHMADVRVALEELREEFESGSLMAAAQASVRKRRARWIPAFVIALVLIAAGATVSWFYLKQRGDSTGAALKVVPLTSLPGEEVMPSISADGNLVAFLWRREGNAGVYVQQVGGGPPLRLTPEGSGEKVPVISPDGRNVAYQTGQGVFVVPSLGGMERKVWSGPGSVRPFLGWTPDSRYIAVVSGMRIVLVPLDAGSEKSIPIPGSSPTLYPSGIWFNPRTREALILRSTGWENGDLYVTGYNDNFEIGSELRRITTDNRLVLGATVYAERSMYLFSSNRGGERGLWAIRPGSEPEKLPFGDNGFHLTYSPAAHRLVYSDESTDTNLYRIPLAPATGEPVQIPFSTREEAMPEISRDGKRIAFASTKTGNWEIWTADPDGSRAVQVTKLAGPRTIHPRFSPDGQQVVFDAVTEADHRDLYLVGSSGGPARRLTMESLNYRASFSPDGKWLVFTSNRSGSSQVWKMPAAGGSAVQLTQGGQRQGFFSADGKNVYASHHGKPGVWSVPSDGGPETLVWDKCAANFLAVTPRGIYCTERSGDKIAIVFFNPETRQSRVLATMPPRGAGGAPNLAVSPDGAWAMVSLLDRTNADLMMVENFQ